MRAAILCMAALAVLPLAGCTSKSVETVKQTLSENKNLTLGEVLGNRSFCDKAKWSDRRSDAGDTIVEYSCLGTIGRDVTDELKRAAHENIEGKVKYATDRFLDEESKAESSYRLAQSYQSAARADAGVLEQQVQDLNEAKSEPMEGRTADEIASIKSGIWRLETQIRNSRLRESADRDGVPKQLADADTVRQQIAALKDTYFADLRAAQAADLEAIDKLYPVPSKIEQKVFFVIDGDRAKVMRLEFYVDGKSAKPNPDRQLFIFRSEITTPKGEPTADWKGWWSPLVAQGFKSQVIAFERTNGCYGNVSCIDLARERANKSSTGS